MAAGRLLGLDEDKMVHALGIAGSYSGGLMEFSRCQEGAMIKRLHLGKARGRRCHRRISGTAWVCRAG